MAFDVVFYNNSSEYKKLNKDISAIVTATGVLKDQSSIINPVISFDIAIQNIVSSNYAYISEFGRYYYITDIVSTYNGLFDVHFKVDVLMSFKDDILLNRGIIQKSEKDWNLYLDDGSLKTYQYKKIETIKFPTGFPTGTDLVMAVAGKSNLG